MGSFLLWVAIDLDVVLLTGSGWGTVLPDVTSLMIIGGVPTLVLAVVVIVVMVTRTLMKRRRRLAGNHSNHMFFVYFLVVNKVIPEYPKEITFCSPLWVRGK